MLIRRYEMPWRSAYEVWAAMAWLSCLVFIVYFAGRGTVTAPAALAIAMLAVFMAGHRFRQGFEVLQDRASLSGRAMQVITTKRLETLTRDPQEIFLGFGFEWLPVHSQRLYELAKIN